jgi:Tfp pilus assembly protein PilN
MRVTLDRMNLHRTRCAVVLIGDRLCVAVVQGSDVEAFVVTSDQPAAALRAELDARKVSPRLAAIGLPRMAVTVKPVELPAIGADTRQMVQFELERHLPFPTDDAVFDFMALPEGDASEDDETARRVLVAAADRRAVDTALRIVQEANLRAASVTVASHNLPALARVPARERVVWLHRVEETIDMLFITRGAVVMSRTLPATDEATLAGEVSRSFGLVQWRGCDQIWLSGDMEAPEAPRGSPLDELGVPVSPPAYTAGARRMLDDLEVGSRGAIELALAVAIAPAERPLDLLPAALRPFRLTRSQMITAGVAAAAVILALTALVVPGQRDARRLATINQDIVRLDGDVRAVEQMLKELDTKRKLVATVEGLETAALHPLPVLRELTDLLPNDAWLTLLSLDAKGVELTGQANAASALIPLLENSPRLERVEFASPVTRGRDREQFRIQAAWERGGTAPVAAASPRAAGGPVAPAPAPGPAVPPAAVTRPPVPPPAAQAPGAPSGMPPSTVAPPPVRPSPPEGRR